MGIPFDVNTMDYAELSKGLGYPPLIYQDKKGDFLLDHEQGFLSPVKRFFCSLFGVRNYQLDKIVNIFSSQEGIHNNPIAVKNLDFFCGKIAHGCGIDNETYKKVLIAEKLLHNTPIAPAEKEVAEKFFASLSKNPQLQKQLGSFRAKFLTDLPEAKEIQSVLERAQITSKWLELGLDLSLLNDDYQGAKFLVQSRLIYSIVGFQNSTVDGPSKHEIKVDPEKSMMIKKQGVYVRASELSKELVFDKVWQEMASKAKPEERWNYFSPDGLVPVDRWLHPEFIPIEQLSKEEMDELRAHAKEFYPEGQEPTSKLPRDAVIQIFTNPREELSFGNFPLISRLSASFPVHAAIRIITNDGKVYSTGFGSTVDEDQYTEKGMLASINGMPTILDYEEFRKHEGRLVTTIPITSDSCEGVLETLSGYRKETIRFNLAKQNCVQLAVDTLDQTGVKVDTVVTGKDFLKKISPAPEALPLVGKSVGEIKKGIKNITEGKFENTSPELLIGAHLVQAVFLIGLSAQELVMYIPSKLATLFCNVLVLSLGGSVGSPLPKDREAGAEVLEHGGELKQFSSLVRNPLDLFNQDTSTLSHALPLIQWQLQQRSTAIHLYDKQPVMGILPPKLTPEIEQKTENKKNHLVKKYLTNFGIV